MVIENAYISGRLGRAVFSDAAGWHVFDLDLATRPAHDSEVIDLLKSDGRASLDNPSHEELRSRLRLEIDTENSLFLIRAILSPHTKTIQRIEYAKAVDEALLQDDLLRRVKARMSVEPLPQEARSNYGNISDYIRPFQNLSELLSGILRAQFRIDEVLGQFNVLMREFSSDDAAVLREQLVREGVLVEFVEATGLENRQDFNNRIVPLALKAGSMAAGGLVRNGILQLRESLEKTFFDRRPAQTSLRIRGAKGGPRYVSTPQEGSIEDLLVGEYHLSKRALTATEAKSSVDKQLESIRREMWAGRLDLVDRFTADLIKFQLDHSEKEHLAKSLCYLSSSAVSANQMDIADRLADYALRLNIDDPVIYTNRAEVYKAMGMFHASLSAYRDAKERFSQASYAWNGVADVLKELGDYEQSLTAYREAAKQFPSSSVPRNGYVSTLKAQGKRRESLAEAIKVAHDFPGDSVTLATLAGALAANGKYRSAVSYYEKIVRSGERPNGHVIGGYVRALNAAGLHEKALNWLKAFYARDQENYPAATQLVSQFRVVGRLQESIALARDVLSLVPGYAPAAFQLAASLVQKGDLDEADQYLPTTQKLRSEMDWAGYRFYLISIIKTKDWHKAFGLLTEAIETCVWAYWRAQFVTLKGFVQIKMKHSRDAVRSLEHGLNVVDERTRQSRLVLISAAEKVRGRSASAHRFLALVSSQDKAFTQFRTGVEATRLFDWRVSPSTELKFLLEAA